MPANFVSVGHGAARCKNPAAAPPEMDAGAGGEFSGGADFGGAAEAGGATVEASGGW